MHSSPFHWLRNSEYAPGRVWLLAMRRWVRNARLRVSTARDRGIRFAGRSPARNRQWCSMRRCGDRAKARRHDTRTTDRR